MTVHVLGEDHDRIHLGRRQPVAELDRVELLADAGDVFGVMEVEVDLAPGPGG